MEISAFSITREEYDRRRINGLCYNCGLGKHLASECRQPKGGKTKTSNQPSSKGRIAELEARLAELEARPQRAARISELEAKIAALEMEDPEEDKADICDNVTSSLNEDARA